MYVYQRTKVVAHKNTRNRNSTSETFDLRNAIRLGNLFAKTFFKWPQFTVTLNLVATCNSKFPTGECLIFSLFWENQVYLHY